MTEKQDLSDHLTAAADIIAEESKTWLWAGWVTYLLEALQEKVGPDDYTAFVQRLQTELSGFLEKGGW